jgi:hypothetical protein
MVNIHPNASAADRKEPLTLWGSTDAKHPFATGLIWRRAFIGAADAPNSLDVTSSGFVMSMSSLGFAIRYTYTASVVLHFGDHDYPISASGSRAAAMNTLSAARQSVELCVADAARQARGIMTIVGEASAKPAKLVAK